MAKRSFAEANEASESEAEGFRTSSTPPESEASSLLSQDFERFDWFYLPDPHNELVWKAFPLKEVEKLYHQPHAAFIMLPYSMIADQPHRRKGVLPHKVRFAILQNHTKSGHPDSLLFSKKYQSYIHIRRMAKVQRHIETTDG